jgi:hypothetical protein
VIKEGTNNPFVSTGKILNLHFLRNMRVAIICDPEGQADYSVPSNSSIKVGLIYQPSPYDELASNYMQLKTVADVTKLKQLPMIVRATTSYDGGSPEKSVKENEILLIKGVGKGRGKNLHMVNILGEEKLLSSKCSGSFSTDPRHTKVDLSVLLSHQGIQWPQFVIFYPSGREITKSLPASMSNALVELRAVSSETSVIATPGESGNMGEGEIMQHVDIRNSE